MTLLKLSNPVISLQHFNIEYTFTLINLIGCLTIKTTSSNWEGIYTLMVSNVHGSSNRSLDVKFHIEKPLNSEILIQPSAACISNYLKTTDAYNDQFDKITTSVRLYAIQRHLDYFDLRDFFKLQEVMVLSITLASLTIICVIILLIWLHFKFLIEKKNERLHRLSTIVSLR